MAAEVGLNVALGLLMRAIDYSDSLLANRYTQYVSVRVMDQAARLDLTTYENPIFYDRLERARVQATDRLGIDPDDGPPVSADHHDHDVHRSSGVRISMAVCCCWRWGWLPSFLGETHYCLFSAYAKNFRQTTAKRQMDYLRQVAGSREGAKEVKLFGLSQYFTSRFRSSGGADLPGGRGALPVEAGGRRSAGNHRNAGATYGAYIYVIWRTLGRAYDIGQFTFLTDGDPAGELEIFSRSFQRLQALRIRRFSSPT